MPNCFQLFPKGTSEPAILQRVDEAICAHLGIPVDPKRWCREWYNTIGFLLAMHGDALDSQKLRERVEGWYHVDDPPEWKAEMLRILDFLKEHYTSNAWVEIGKRG